MCRKLDKYQIRQLSCGLFELMSVPITFAVLCPGSLLLWVSEVVGLLEVNPGVEMMVIEYVCANTFCIIHYSSRVYSNLNSTY